jgi:hypothetical protein
MTMQSNDQKELISQWLHDSESKQGNCEPFSIVIASPCLVCQPRIAEALTTYLNEFDERSDGSTWLFVNEDRYEKIRDRIKSEASHPWSERLEKENLNDFLVSCGNVVFESSNLEAETFEGESIFQVHLSCSEPESSNHHLWLNAKKIDPQTLTLMIASSFIDWANRDSNWTSAHSHA